MFINKTLNGNSPGCNAFSWQPYWCSLAIAAHHYILKELVYQGRVRNVTVWEHQCQPRRHVPVGSFRNTDEFLL